MSKLKATALAFALIASFGGTLPVQADETCNSPYTTKLIKGQEDFVHVWTLGVKGMAKFAQSRYATGSGF